MVNFNKAIEEKRIVWMGALLTRESYEHMTPEEQQRVRDTFERPGVRSIMVGDVVKLWPVLVIGGW